MRASKIVDLIWLLPREVKQTLDPRWVAQLRWFAHGYWYWEKFQRWNLTPENQAAFDAGREASQKMLVGAPIVSEEEKNV